jgi:hypothetical protein
MNQKRIDPSVTAITADCVTSRITSKQRHWTMLNKLFDRPPWTAYDCNLLQSFHIKPPARPPEKMDRPALYVGLTMVVTGFGFLALCVAHLIANS